jgi:hypothetical protein
LTPPLARLSAQQANSPGVDPGVVKHRFDPPLRPDPELYRCRDEAIKSRAKARKEKPARPGQPSARDKETKKPLCPNFVPKSENHSN